MSDHEELVEEQERQADRLEQENERIGKAADGARSKLDQANSDEMIPEGLGQRDPAHRQAAPTDEEDDHDGDDLASAEGPSGDETAPDAEEPQGDDEGRGDETP